MSQTNDFSGAVRSVRRIDLTPALTPAATPTLTPAPTLAPGPMAAQPFAPSVAVTPQQSYLPSNPNPSPNPPGLMSPPSAMGGYPPNPQGKALFLL